MMTTLIENIRAVSKRGVCVLAASGILLTVGAASAQNLDDTAMAAPSSPRVFTANPADAAVNVNDDGEPSSAFEFASPVRAITAAPRAAASGGSPVVNPASNTLSGSTVHLPTGNVAVLSEVPRNDPASSTATKVGACALLVGGLLALGIVVVRVTAQDRARGRSQTA